MIKIKKEILKTLGITYGSLFIYLVVVSVLYLVNLFNYKVIGILNFIALCIMFLVSGILFSRNINKKGIISGLIIGGINIVLLLVLCLIFRTSPSISSIIYYLLLLISSVLGGIIGKNTKKEKLNSL
ncbi:MAG: TIGR04086 family membrane protein [Bacilli bacterium]